MNIALSDWVLRDWSCLTCRHARWRLDNGEGDCGMGFLVRRPAWAGGNDLWPRIRPSDGCSMWEPAE